MAFLIANSLAQLSVANTDSETAADTARKMANSARTIRERELQHTQKQAEIAESEHDCAQQIVRGLLHFQGPKFLGSRAIFHFYP